jgi:hypothetical protein
MLNASLRQGMLRSTVAIALVAAGTSVVTAAPAHAAQAAQAASCYIVCDGVDPEQARYENSQGALVRCGGFSTVKTAPVPGGGTVELRYSRQCRMAWARGSYVQIRGYNANGSLRVTYGGYGGTSAQTYTPAVNDAGLTARACAFVFSSGGQYACTDPY